MTGVQGSWILLLVLLVGGVSSQQCTKGYIEGAQCASQGAVTLTCPPGHYIDMIGAFPRTLLDPGCSTDPHDVETACNIEPLTDYIQTILCYQTSACTIPVHLFRSVTLASCNTYQGENILYYKYRCDPEYHQKVSICSANVWDVTAIEIAPNIDAFSGQVGNSLISDTNCACAFPLPANMEVTFVRRLFLISPFSYNCAQRVVIVDDDGEVAGTLCLNEDITLPVPCADHDRMLFVTYETDDPSVKATFNIEVTVSHNETLHVQCGLTYTPPGSFTTPLPTTPEPTTTQPTTTTTPTTTTPTTTSPTTTTTATTTTTMSTTTTTPAITTEPTTMSQSTTTTSTTSSSTTTSSPSSSSVSVPSSESTTVSTTPPANGTFGGRDRDSDDSNTVFGFSKEMLIGAIVGGLAFIMILTALAVLVRARTRGDADGDTPSTTNIAENFYEEPDYPYSGPYIPPPKEPTPAQYNLNMDPTTDENIYSTLPNDDYNMPTDDYTLPTAGFSTGFSGTGVMPMGSQEEIAHNPLYGRDIFAY